MQMCALSQTRFHDDADPMTLTASHIGPRI